MAKALIGALRVNLGLNSANFSKGIKRAESTTQRFARQMKVAMAGAAAAATGAFIAIRGAAQDAQTALEQAQISGAGYEEFQKLAYGAKQYGIQADKLSDIFKDVNDKVGDFVQTGGGPLADFFENIAPKVGLTVDQFARLSGPEALQAYFDALEKANLTQAETTFYMEAIASDATMLLPLLRKNGEEFKRLGEQAERLGLVLDQKTGLAAVQFNHNLTSLTSVMTGFWNKILANVIPSMTALTNRMVQASQQGGFLDQAVRGISAAMNIAAKAISVVFDNLNHLYDLFKVFVAIKIASFMFAAARSFILFAKAVRVAGLTSALFSKVISGKITLLVGLAWAAMKVTNTLDTFTAAMKEAGEQVANALPENLRNAMADLSGPLKGFEGDITDVDLALTGLGGRAMDMADAAANSFGKVGRAGKAAADGIKRSAEELKAAGLRVFEATRTPLEKYNDKIKDLNELVQAGAIDWETYRRAVKMAQDEFEEMDSQTDSLSNKFKDMFKSVGASLRGVIDGSKNWLDVLSDIMMNLAQMAFSNINFGGGFGGIIGSLFSGLFGFAKGGTIMPGGTGGIDSQLVAFRKSPNERVDITKPGQQLTSGAGNVQIDQTFVLDGAIDGQRIQQMIQQGTAQSVETVKRALPDWQVQQQTRGAIA